MFSGIRINASFSRFLLLKGSSTVVRRKTVSALAAATLLLAFALGLFSAKPAHADAVGEDGSNLLTIAHTTKVYSAEGNTVSITAGLLAGEEFDYSDYRVGVEFESGETKEFSGDDIHWRDVSMDGQSVAVAAVSFEVFGAQKISYRLYCEDELLRERTLVEAVKPLALSPGLFAFDQESKTVVPTVSDNTDGALSSSTVLADDVRCYVLVDGVEINLDAWNPSLPGTHQVMVAAASKNVTGEVVLCSFTVPEDGVSEDPLPETSVPEAPISPMPSAPEASDSQANEPAQDGFSFEDVPEGAWFEEAVYGVAEAGIMEPVDETHFGVRDVLTRGEAAWLVMRMLGGEPEKGCAFSDVSEGDSYAGAIEWVRLRGIMTGYAGTTCFGPSDSLTQEQAAAVLFNIRLRMGVSSVTEGSELGILASIPGGEDVSPWAQSAVAWVLENEWSGLLSLCPQVAVTRGWMAVCMFEELAKTETTVSSRA